MLQISQFTSYFATKFCTNSSNTYRFVKYFSKWLLMLSYSHFKLPIEIYHVRLLLKELHLLSTAQFNHQYCCLVCCCSLGSLIWHQIIVMSEVIHIYTFWSNISYLWVIKVVLTCFNGSYMGCTLLWDVFWFWYYLILHRSGRERSIYGLEEAGSAMVMFSTFFVCTVFVIAELLPSYVFLLFWSVKPPFYYVIVGLK
jgi:hypothetical protein